MLKAKQYALYMNWNSMVGVNRQKKYPNVKVELDAQHRRKQEPTVGCVAVDFSFPLMRV